MGPMMQGLHPERLEVFAGEPMQGTAGHGPKRRGESEEQGAVWTGRTDSQQVANDRLPHHGQQRIRRGVSRFWARHPEHILVPIEVVETELGDFTDAEAIERKEHEDRAIPDIPWLVGVERGQETLHGGPGRPAGRLAWA